MWASVFNLFIISLAWSLLNDIYSKDSSKKFFGIITAGASLGSITGASFVSFFKDVGLELFFALSLGFLLASLLLKKLIITHSSANSFESPLKATNPFAGARLVFGSKYLLGIAGFILLLTAVSTFLYSLQSLVARKNTKPSSFWTQSCIEQGTASLLAWRACLLALALLLCLAWGLLSVLFGVC